MSSSEAGQDNDLTDENHPFDTNDPLTFIDNQNSESYDPYLDHLSLSDTGQDDLWECFTFLTNQDSTSIDISNSAVIHTTQSDDFSATTNNCVELENHSNNIHPSIKDQDNVKLASSTKSSSLLTSEATQNSDSIKESFDSSMDDPNMNFSNSNSGVIPNIEKNDQLSITHNCDRTKSDHLKQSEKVKLTSAGKDFMSDYYKSCSDGKRKNFSKIIVEQIASIMHEELSLEKFRRKHRRCIKEYFNNFAKDREQILKYLKENHDLIIALFPQVTK